MSIRARLTAPVETIPVWRYLMEKAAHVALIAWAVIMLWPAIPWTDSRVAATIALIYTLGGKAWYHSRNRGKPLRVADLGRDLVVAAVPAVFADFWITPIRSAILFAVIAIVVVAGPEKQ